MQCVHYSEAVLYTIIRMHAGIVTLLAIILILSINFLSAWACIIQHYYYIILSYIMTL
jgi:hypothetical protein